MWMKEQASYIPSSTFPVIIFVTFLFIYLLFYVPVSAIVHVWRPEDNLRELVHHFYNVGLGDGTQVISFATKYLYPMSHLASPPPWFFASFSPSLPCALCSLSLPLPGSPAFLFLFFSLQQIGLEPRTL